LLAVLYAAQTNPLDAELNIKTTDRKLIADLTHKLEEREDLGWYGHEDKEIAISTVAQLRSRSGETSFSYITPGSTEARQVQALATTSQNLQAFQQDNTIHEGINGRLTGARLSKVSQAIAYRLIRDLKIVSPRTKTLQNMDITRWNVASRTGILPEASKIWKSLNCKDIRKPVQVFLWRTMHGAYKIGPYWDHIPNYEHRSNCPICEVPETMEHILIDCRAPERQQIWDLARATWEQKSETWIVPSLGMTLSSCLPHVEKGSTATSGINRAYRIIVPEAAYLIWKLRCERRIENGDDPEKAFSQNEVTGRWNEILNRRFQQDRILTNRERFGPKALDENLVLETWTKIAYRSNGEPLPDNWIWEPGVLVG
ncbi:hypothetical protein ARMSODRAFT_866108, partial [Armillaria solidipes]